MRTVHRVDEVRAAVSGWRAEGQRVALVPTMGSLHSGHLALIRRAREVAERSVVSIFVNPLQFAPGEDFDAYPRNLVADSDKLHTAENDLVFAPAIEVMYPRDQAQQTRVEVPGISDILCGASRPGHFTGVATVVCKLLNQVKPDYALFGEKDYQQLLVIRRMVADLDLDVEIIDCPTVRERDGLAMSSRNAYLSDNERPRAAMLYTTLQAMKDEIEHGRRDYGGLESEAAARLEAAGWRCDYLSIRRAADLALPSPEDGELVIVAAAFLGKSRLIDNLKIRL